MNICRLEDLSTLKHFLLNVPNADIYYVEDQGGNTPLSAAFNKWRPEIIMALYAQDNDKNLLPYISSFSSQHEYFLPLVLRQACIKGNSMTVEKLYQTFMESFWAFSFINPIPVAALTGQLEIIKLIIRLDGRLVMDQEKKHGHRKSMEIDEYIGHWDIFKYLKGLGVEKSSAKCDIEFLDSLLLWACANGLKDAVVKVISDNVNLFDRVKHKIICEAYSF